MVKKPACSWTAFVANRVTKIAQATKIENWSHVRPEHNSADLASRGVSLQELGDSTLWWHGPQWLQLPKLQWPETSDPHPVTDLEQRAVKVHFVQLPGDDFLERFSRLDKALRVVAYVQRFLNRCRKAPAIHLEATSDLTTEKYLATFARFVARRGCPQRVHPDNGKTFVGASSLLSCDFTQALMESVTAAYSYQGLVWRFIPPGAPHIGGLWEAGVRSFKTLFYKSTSARKYTFKKLSALFAKIEACLNSKPLFPITEDPTELLALTPGHFLIGGPLLSTAEPEIKCDAMSIINRWQHLKAQHQQFSSRWKEDYLKELHKRNKWLSPSRNLEVDDMVVIRDDNLPSNDWRLGRIVAAIPGADARVRVVDILTSRGTIQRPIHKLVLLPMEAKATAKTPQ
ncbi:uncharacterized protein LOC121530548 [Drosophila eugracilis]|uniref:uncharacterized protein LOC121530548 n=1 Tax=Drosophila eugracilis TaxID=29029 RepID=UPI001BDA6866|nr:uncharacterized protein LOC121530548 [Drosophila eugracilis]